MPNLEIANLPVVITPAGADVIAVSQGAVTRKISLTQILADATLAGSFTSVLLPLGGTAAAPTLRYGDGNSGIWQETDDELSFGVAGVERFTLDVATGFHAFLSAGPAMLNENASGTNPTMIPRRNSPTTGWGSSGADELSGVIAGVEQLRLTGSEFRLPPTIDIVTFNVNWFSQLTNTSFAISGGSSISLGSNIVFYGEAAGGGQANDFLIRASATTRLMWDESEGEWIMTGAFKHNGSIGFFNTAPTVRNTGWVTFTNLSVLKTADADSGTLPQLYDIVGTLIEEIKAKGLVGA